MLPATMRAALTTLLALLVASGCEGTTRRHHSGAGSTPPLEAPQHRTTAVEAARGGSYLGRATCGESHQHAIQMGANESLQVMFRGTLSSAEPLGEDVSWRWIGPTGAVLDTNELPTPTPNGPAVERTWEVRAAAAGRYVLAVVIEEGAACSHLSYTLQLR